MYHVTATHVTSEREPDFAFKQKKKKKKKKKKNKKVRVVGMGSRMKEDEQNISRYIQNLDVANVLTADLSLDNHTYIDPSIEQAYRRTLEHHKNQVKGSPKTTAIPASFNSDSVRFDVDGVPPIPQGTDPRKICPFCQKTFSHPGSMGRHLDLKKGSKQHPADVIEKMRAEVKRRGDADKVRERRRIRARKYNSREDVRQRVREQRKVRERIQRVKRREIKKFFDKLHRPELQSHLQHHPTFPRLVLYFLHPAQWPQDPPTLETYRLLCGSLNDQFLPNEDMSFYDDVMQKVHTASESWLTLSDEDKLDVWNREIRRAAEDALTNTSLFELRNRDTYVSKEAHRQVENNEDNDELDDDNSDADNEDNEEKETSDKEYYNHEELAAVAEAVVNTNKEHNHLDPELVS